MQVQLFAKVLRLIIIDKTLHCKCLNDMFCAVMFSD